VESQNTIEGKRRATSTLIRSYFARWRGLSRGAKLYLLHAALLTSSLAIARLFFNLTILALGYPLTFIGTLDTIGIAVAAVLSVPLWWLVTRIGYRRAMMISAVLQTAYALLIALAPSAGTLMLAVALTGITATMFQVSSPPFMMQHSDDATRDHLFSANWAINIGVAGIASLIAGGVPALFGRLLDVDAESALAYRGAFAVAGAGLALSLLPLVVLGRFEGSKVRRFEGSKVETSRARTFTPSHFLTFTRFLPPPIRQLLRQPWSLIRLLISPLLISFGAAMLIRYLDLFFKGRFAISDLTLGSIFATIGIATGLSALLAPIISNRIGKIRTVATMQALSIPFLLLVGFTPLLPLAVLGEVMRRSLFNMGTPLYDAFAMEQSEEAVRPFVIGIINGAYTVGYLVAPMISTRVQVRYGFTPLFIATTLCYGLAVLANYLLFVRGRLHSPDSAL
jgi:MFS family permease